MVVSWLISTKQHGQLTLNLNVLTRLNAALVRANAVLLGRCGLDLECDGRRVGVLDEERALDDGRQRAWRWVSMLSFRGLSRQSDAVRVHGAEQTSASSGQCVWSA